MKDRQLLVAVAAAGLIIAISLGLKYLVSTGTLDPVVSKRISGVIIGIVLAVTGNYLPKTLKPISERPCDSSRWISLRRFAGWAFLIAGLSYSAVWAFAPIDLSSVLAMSIVGTAVLLVLVPFAWLVISRKRGQPSTEV